MKNALLSLAAAALLLAACGKKEQPAAQAEAPAPAAPAAQAAKAPAAPAAAYSQKDTYFKLPGKPVLVMFFTETCPYCRKAAPFIQQVSASFGRKGLGVVGICVQDSAQAAVNFAADFGLTFPLAYGGGAVSRAYRTQGVPYIYLLTKDHEIYDVWEGYDPRYDPSILKGVETVLAKK